MDKAKLKEKYIILRIRPKIKKLDNNLIVALIYELRKELDIRHAKKERDTLEQRINAKNRTTAKN